MEMDIPNAHRIARAVFQKNLVVWKLRKLNMRIVRMKLRVSEELSSMEIAIGGNIDANSSQEFQKNLVVWKFFLSHF